MKVYLAMSRCRRAEALVLGDRLQAMGIEIVSTWPNYPEALPGDGRRSAKVRADVVDREIASAAAMLVVRDPDPLDEDGPELFIRVGQAIDIYQPVLWVGKTTWDAHRTGFRAVETIDEALPVLELWASKLRGGIPAEYARKAIFAYLQNQEAQELERLDRLHAADGQRTAS